MSGWLKHRTGRVEAESTPHSSVTGEVVSVAEGSHGGGGVGLSWGLQG